jgi:hypothetical protein
VIGSPLTVWETVTVPSSGFIDPETGRVVTMVMLSEDHTIDPSTGRVVKLSGDYEPPVLSEDGRLATVDDQLDLTEPEHIKTEREQAHRETIDLERSRAIKLSVDYIPRSGRERIRVETGREAFKDKDPVKKKPDDGSWIFVLLFLVGMLIVFPMLMYKSCGERGDPRHRWGMLNGKWE